MLTEQQPSLFTDTRSDNMDIHKFKTIFEYRDGDLFWRVCTPSRIAIGGKAGWVDGGYRKVSVGGKNLLMHRVIFAIHRGYLPKFVDHKDGDKLNNKIENLREATKEQNQSNSKIPATNSSGVKGVSWKAKNNAWVVQISKNGKKIHIGLFKDFELAKLVADEARDKYHGEFARYC